VKGFCFAAASLVLTGGLVGTLNASGFDFKVGLGYDFFSQEYFLDSTLREGPDSLFVDWSLRTDYLDDVKGQLDFIFSPYADRRVELQSSYEQTPQFVRTRFIGDFRPRLGKNRLDINSEIEWRDRYRGGDASFGDSYLSGYFKAKLTVPVGGTTTADFRIQSDGVRFRAPSEFNYNFYRIGAKVGLTKSYENFSLADVRLFVITRQVPDSLELNYLNWGAEGSLLGFYTGWEIDLYTRFERKDYRRAAGQDDYYRGELNARSKVKLGEHWFARQDVDFELTLYGAADPVNNDYGRTGVTLLYGYESNGFSIGFGPDFEYLDERQDSLAEGEDYFESGAKLDLDYVGDFFCSIESTLGYRNLKFDNELQSDFTFHRLSVIADLKLLSILTLSVLFSAEWEWHTIPEENSQIVLLSSNLSYAF
jgi:hypothetical protein